MREERPSDAALNRFWNALIGAADPVDDAADPLDPADAATLRRLEAMRQAAPPETARARVDAALQPYVAAPGNGQASWERDGAPPVARWVSQPVAAPRRRWPAARWWSVGQLAAAALLLLTLGIGV